MKTIVLTPEMALDIISIHLDCVEEGIGTRSSHWESLITQSCDVLLDCSKDQFRRLLHGHFGLNRTLIKKIRKDPQNDSSKF